MTMSPGSRSGVNDARTVSTAPAGTMSHIARGFDSEAMKPFMSELPLAPFSTHSCTFDARAL